MAMKGTLANVPHRARRYGHGAALRVISLDNGWVQVTDPISREILASSLVLPMKRC